MTNAPSRPSGRSGPTNGFHATLLLAAAIVATLLASLGSSIAAAAQSPGHAPLPSIEGSPRVGGRLVARIARSPHAHTSYAWQRCRRSPRACVTLAGRSTRTYVPTRADVGFHIRVGVAVDPTRPQFQFAAETAAVQMSMPRGRCTGTQLRVGMNIQSIIATKPPGTTFCLRSGVYRLSTPIVPRTGDSLIGEAGTTLSGALDISSSFHPAGTLWAASGMTLSGYDTGQYPDTCAGGSGVTSCRRLNDVYFDNRPLHRVETLEAVRKGSFFFDYDQHVIYLGVDPAGHTVEVGAFPLAIASSIVKAYPTNVTLRGLTVEKFANQSQQGAVNGFLGWRVEGCTFRLNHAEGLTAASNSAIHSNAFLDNGELGFGTGVGSNIVFSDNLIVGNNYARYNPSWDAGGVKFYNINRAFVFNNVVETNVGTGIWIDGESVHARAQGNWIEGNSDAGISIEISYEASVSGNVVAHNGFDPQLGWIDGSGILVSSSPDVEVSNNQLVDNRQGIGATETGRGDGSRGPLVLTHLNVHDNSIRVTRTPRGIYAVAAGIAGDHDVLDPSYGNRWESNHYVVCSYIRFIWTSFPTWAQWRAIGMDTRGSLRSVC